MRKVMRTTWILGALFCLGLPLLAQTLGDVSGRVNDPSGAGVPSAAVSLTNVNTNAVRNVDTTSDGFYTFSSVPPGVYNIKVEHPGFRAAATTNVEVQVQQSVRLDVTLQVGQVSETVEVTAEAALLQAQNATLGHVVENREIVEAPLNGRQYLNLVTLAPNISNLAPASGQAGSRQGGDRAVQAIAPSRRSPPAGTALCMTISRSTA